MNNKFFLCLEVFVFLVLLSNFALAEKEFLIDVNIESRGIISLDYNVVGDIFSYNVSLKSNNSEAVEDAIRIEIFAPDNRPISKSIREYSKIWESNETKSLIPYTEGKEKNETNIWLFDVAGDYRLSICSLDLSTKFIKSYEVKKDGRIIGVNYYYQSGCFDYYFSAMPEWQYSLFQKEFAAANKTLNINTKLESATRRMVLASWIMVIVVIASLYVSSREEKDKKIWMYKFVKFISSFVMFGLIIYFIINAIIFLIYHVIW